MLLAKKVVSSTKTSDTLYSTNSMNTNLLTAKLQEKSIGHKLHILTHEITVHSDQSNGKSVCKELLLDIYCFLDHILDHLWMRMVHEMLEEEAGKVCVQALKTSPTHTQLGLENIPQSHSIGP